MALQIIGDRVDSIEANRVEELERELTIKTNAPNIISIEKKELAVAGDLKKSLVFTYEYSVEYGQSGKIKIKASIIAIGTTSEMDEVKKQWEKKKEIDADLLIPVLNRMMEVAVIASIPAAKELRLPPPIQIPRFKKGEQPKVDAQ